MTEPQVPTEVFVVDENGVPTGHVNLAQIQTNAARLAFELAEHSEDADALDAIAARWAHSLRPRELGYVAFAACRVLAGPVLGMMREVGYDLVPWIREAAAHALNEDGDRP